MARRYNTVSVLDVQYTAISSCGEVGYTAGMSRIIRSVMLQTRVTPEIKLATDHVLQRLGLNMTEAIELFLRKMVVDQRIPFEVAAIDNATYTELILDWEEQSRTIATKRNRHMPKASRARRRQK